MTAALLLDPPSSPIGSQAPLRGGALVTGQSNAGFFISGEPYAHGQLNGALADMWGVERGHYTIGSWNGAEGWALAQGAIDHVFTTFGGTPLWDEGGDGAFLADTGAHPSTWQPGWVGQGVRNFILNQMSAEERAQVPFVFWLHSESDTQVRTPDQREKYKAAVQRWCQLLRSWLGKTAQQLPVFTAAPMPYDPASGLVHEMVRGVFAELAADPAMNFRVALRNTADCEPRDGVDGSHIDGPDLEAWARRLALAAGRWYGALYGYRNNVAWGGLGPRIVHSWAESPTTTVITVRHDRGTALKFLGPDLGADGRGWGVIDNGIWRPVRAAAITGPSTVRITHDACDGPDDARLVSYCLFGERLGRNGAVYDNASTLAPPPGLSTDFALDLPVAQTMALLASSSTPADGSGGPAYSIALNPRNPGTVNRAADGTAPWTTSVSTVGGSSVEWAIFTPSGQARSGWNTLDGTDAPGGALVTIPFVAGGDYLQVRKPGDDGVRLFTDHVAIEEQPGPWAGAARGQASATGTLGERRAGRFIELSPPDPGTLLEAVPGEGAVWTVRVDAGEVARIGWAVVRPDFSWREAHTEADVGPNGSVVIQPRLVGTGDFLKVFDAADFSLQVDSGQATIASGTGTGDGTRSLALRPNQPGTVYEQVPGGGAPFTFFIDSSGIARLGWVVVKSSDFAFRSGVNVIEAPGPSVQVTARIVETGDFIKVMDADDPGFFLDSGLATVALDTGGGGLTDPADVAFAQAWVKGLALGADLERAWAWEAPGGAAVAAAYLKSQGFDYVRLFYRWRPAVDMGDGTALPTKAQFDRILDAAAAYMAAGLKVILDCCDVLEAWTDFLGHEGTIYQHVRNCAAWIAERNFDRTKFACGPVNEWAGDDDYTVHQAAFHGILRAALPGYVLVCGSNGWKHYSRLIARAPFTRDGRVIWDFHSYDAKTAAEWQQVAAQISAWAQAHGGLACMWTEAGLGYAGWWENGVYRPGQEENPQAWVANLAAMFPAMNKFRPGVWAFTYGVAWRVNKPGANELRDGTAGGDDADLATALPALGASIRLSLGDGGGAPGDPGDGVVIPPLPSILGLFNGPDAFDILAKIVLRQAVTNAHANFLSLGAFAAGAQEALKDLAVELVALDNLARARIAELEAVNTAQAAEIANLRNTNTTQGQQITALQGVNGTQAGQIQALQDAVGGLQGTSGGQGDQIGALQGDVQNLWSDSASQATRLASLESRLAAAGIA